MWSVYKWVKRGHSGENRCPCQNKNRPPASCSVWPRCAVAYWSTGSHPQRPCRGSRPGPWLNLCGSPHPEWKGEQSVYGRTPEQEQRHSIHVSPVTTNWLLWILLERNLCVWSIFFLTVATNLAKQKITFKYRGCYLDHWTAELWDGIWCRCQWIDYILHWLTDWFIDSFIHYQFILQGVTEVPSRHWVKVRYTLNKSPVHRRADI